MYFIKIKWMWENIKLKLSTQSMFDQEIGSEKDFIIIKV